MLVGQDRPGVCQVFLSYDTYWWKEKNYGRQKYSFNYVMTVNKYYEEANRQRIDRDNIDIIVQQ